MILLKFYPILTKHKESLIISKTKITLETNKFIWSIKCLPKIIDFVFKKTLLQFGHILDYYLKTVYKNF